MRLLLVDDNEDVLNLLSRFVETIGHESLSACNGKEALGTLNTEPVDVMVTDLLMPVMDGVTLAKRVRESYPDVRIVGVAGKDVPVSERSLFDIFVGKPFQLDDIEKAIG